MVQESRRCFGFEVQAWPTNSDLDHNLVVFSVLALCCCWCLFL